MSAPLKTSQMRWTEEQTVALCDALAKFPTLREAANHLGLTLKAVQARTQVLRAKGDDRLGLRKGGVRGLPVPEGFADRAGATVKALAAYYGVSKSTVDRWRRERGLMPGRTSTSTTFKPLPMPENFAQLAPTMLAHEARAFFGVTDGPLRRWAMDAGVTFRRTAVAIHRATSFKVDRTDNRDMSRAGLAADFLRRFGPVFRCNERGNLEGKPTHWRRGSFVLTNEEIIERAERNGWRPDAWKQIAA